MPHSRISRSEMQSYESMDSILSLFDPLSAPKTPPRNTSSPDSLSSDKENDASSRQPGPMTTFFNRVYKEDSAQEAKLSKGKLIDYGDGSFTSCNTEEEPDENVPDANSEDIVDASPPKCRRPLADLEIERPASFATPAQDFRHVPTLPQVPWTENISLSPFIAPPSPTSEPTLSDVVNEINLSAMAISDDKIIRANAQSAVSHCPDITVDPPEAENNPAESQELSSPTESLCPLHLSPVASTSTRRTHTPSSISAHDPRRTSVDLQSTFSLHMQSPEMSFDILNDRISFITSANSSYTLADADQNDDTFDLAKEQLKMEEIAAQYMKPVIDIEEDTFDLVKERKRMEAALKAYAPIHEESLDEIVMDLPGAQEQSSPKPTVSTELESRNTAKSVSRPPVFSLPPISTRASDEEQETNPSAEIPAAPASPTQAAETVPVFAMAKKIFKLSRDRNSANLEPSTLPSTSEPQSRVHSISKAKNSSDAPRTSNGIFKLPARRSSNASLTVKPPLRVRTASAAVPATPSAGLARPPATPRTVAPSSMATPSGFRRPPPSASTSAPTKPIAGLKASVAPATSRLYRPALPSTTRREGPASVSAQSKPMLRQPSTSVSSTTSGAKSTLPRPTSRLPAPSKAASSVARRL